MKTQIQLHELFIKLFPSTTDVRNFVHFNIHDIERSLPGESATMDNLCFSLVDLLNRRNYIDQELFRSLANRFPQNLDAIEKVAKFYGF